MMIMDISVGGGREKKFNQLEIVRQFFLIIKIFFDKIGHDMIFTPPTTTQFD